MRIRAQHWFAHAARCTGIYGVLGLLPRSQTRGDHLGNLCKSCPTIVYDVSWGNLSTRCWAIKQLTLATAGFEGTRRRRGGQRF